jgi:hypothetical protein
VRILSSENSLGRIGKSSLENVWVGVDGPASWRFRLDLDFSWLQKVFGDVLLYPVDVIRLDLDSSAWK